MRRGQHAADDGSFGRSAGGAMARGVVLIIAAVLLGIVLLKATDSPSVEATDGGTTSEQSGGGTTTTAAGGSSTTTQAAHDPATVTVLVLNGSGINGLASQIGDKLKAANYVIAEPTNTKAPADQSAVYYTAGYQADAEQIAALLTPAPKVSPMPQPAPVEDLKGAHVVVVAAADLANAAG